MPLALRSDVQLGFLCRAPHPCLSAPKGSRASKSRVPFHGAREHERVLSSLKIGGGSEHLMHPSTVVFGFDPAWVATILLLASYALIVSERLNRSIIALLGAGMMIVSGVLTQDEAIRGVDFNTLALLAGTMVLVSIAGRSGLFEYLAIWSAKKGRAQPWAMLAMLSVITAVLSALLNNVTTVLLIAPVTLSITRRLEVPPYPFLFAEVFAANIGGTATLIGDPPTSSSARRRI
jgi:hypothetical protein